MKLENGIRVFTAGTWGSNEKYLTTYRNDKTYGFITSNSLEQLRGGIIDEIKSWDSKYMSQQWGKFLIDSHEDNSINC